MKFPSAFRSLSEPWMRRFLGANAVAQIGNYIQLVVSSWLLYRLSGSTFLLGLAAFALHIPFLLIGPVAGVFVDRLPLRRVIVAMNLVAVMQAIFIFVFAFNGWIRPWHLVLANLVLGIVNASDAPARQSLLSLLVRQRSDLQNAIALNSTTINLARFLGPLLGGGAVAMLGETMGFALNSFTRLPLLVVALAMPVAARVSAREHKSWVAELAAGFRYAFGFAPTRNVLLLLAAGSVTAQAYPPLLPWFAAQRFHGNSSTLGILLGAGGLGALTGMMYLASRTSVRGLFRLIGRTSACAGLGLVAFTFCENVWVGVFALYCTGLAAMMSATSSNTVLQTIVPDELRGRIVSLYAMAFLGAAPFGAITAGWLAEHLGPPHALLCCGIFTLLAAGLYLRGMRHIVPQVRSTYERLGIIPPTAR
jgi:MFS family permease